jgi:hypothetical protein
MSSERYDPGTPPGTATALDDEPQGTGPEALDRLRAQLEELAEYGRTYLAARKDAIVVGVRRAALWTAVGVVGLAIACALLCTATVIGILGLAQLVGQALDAPWAGYVIVGFGLLALAVLGLLAAVVVLNRSFRRSTVKKYERRHQRQRARFGRDIETAGAEPEGR